MIPSMSGMGLVDCTRSGADFERGTWSACHFAAGQSPGTAFENLDDGLANLVVRRLRVEKGERAVLASRVVPIEMIEPLALFDRARFDGDCRRGFVGTQRQPEVLGILGFLEDDEPVTQCEFALELEVLERQHLAAANLELIAAVEI